MGFAPGKQRTGTQQALLTCWCVLGQSEIWCWCWCWCMCVIMLTVTCTCCLLHSICYMPIISDQLVLLLAQELLQRAAPERNTHLHGRVLLVPLSGLTYLALYRLFMRSCFRSCRHRHLCSHLLYGCALSERPGALVEVGSLSSLQAVVAASPETAQAGRAVLHM